MVACSPNVCRCLKARRSNRLPMAVRAVCFMLLALGASRLSGAATIRVPADQPTIQQAIAAATSGDLIVVSPGIYFETIDFGGNVSTTLKLMAMNSTIAVYATNGNRTPVLPMRDLMEKCIAVRALVLFALPPPLLAAAQADITKWLKAGKRIHNVAAQFALSDTAQAHLAVEKGDKLGTVIVDCAR